MTDMRQRIETVLQAHVYKDGSYDYGQCWCLCGLEVGQCDTEAWSVHVTDVLLSALQPDIDAHQQDDAEWGMRG